MKLRILPLLTIFLLIQCSGIPRYYLPEKSSRVVTGLERFISSYADDYRGKKLLLVTNHSGVDIRLRDNISLLRREGLKITTVLAPEHGIYGYQNQYDKKKYFRDEKRRLTIYNMHKLKGKEFRAMARRAYAVIFDIQDMGMRCYTYISNLKFIMDNMQGLKTEFIVLDRPNPIGFLETDGAFLERKFTTKYISAFPAPFIYNMTMAEAARYYKEEYNKKVNLKVVPMRGYYRGMLFHETMLPWVPPSPNLPTYESAIVYTAMVLLEGVNISIGRGTTKPFEYLGAPWIDPVTFSRDLNRMGFKNFHFRPVYFKPTFSKYKDEVCGGAQVFYTGDGFSPTKMAYRLTAYLFAKHPEVKWEKFRRWYDIDYLAGTNRFRIFIARKRPWKDYRKYIKRNLKKYEKKRRRHTLY